MSSFSAALNSAAQANDRLKTLQGQVHPATQQYDHPLDPLSATEISVASSLIKAKHLGKRFQFRYVTLVEPPKKQLTVYLDEELAGRAPSQKPDRIVEALYSVFDNETGWSYKCYESIVNLTTSQVVKEQPLPEGAAEPLSFKTMANAQEILVQSKEFKDAVAKLNLPENIVIEIDPWMYGVDQPKAGPTRLSFLCYARHPSNNHPDGNIYSIPLPIIPLMDLQTMTVLSIEPAASGGTEDGFTYGTHPERAIDHCIANEYVPELQPKGLRKDLKPLQVVQPEGASFTIKGRLVEWQKWRFRVGWNYREGAIIHDVTYDGRRVFHRLSLSDMTVPYGDPRTPYHRKQAFDLGDLGAGLSANNLALGCDCLGLIHYFPGALTTHTGEGEVKGNAVCLHEQDMGIGWKHTNYRTDRAVLTRNRMLVVQQILTVANYEYIFAWQFDQAGAIHFETRATGILSTCMIDPGKVSEWGNVVSPGVLAQYHQHIFCLRIDPAIDGWQNSVVQEEAVSLPISAERNPFGNAFVTEKKVIKTSSYADAAPHKNRVFKIINPSKFNPHSKNPVSYKLVPHTGQLLLADPGSVAAARARFAQHHIWVTKHRDEDLWCAGKFTNQASREDGGVQDMIERNENVENDDILVWHTFGMTHIPRVEDFPVMPVEIHQVSLKPADFFDRNPAIDVPASNQLANKSVLYDDFNAKSGSCCS
ncbi:hypothetical protein AOL_s00043g433 [Orbilia oligospora ATCC 24927]|uniref:Amine oxidase n=1 Tax=Arthrobotrys oligospora (strain ATCC 24927 / CBS 115.81 / DSM 1491) TaxID=756982 RepID=G1X409_ARTOA|nr:hypothetical protein AOL_s00043g433 [Orbilia oligospora ATCC 24927]EGX52043.1 hypothetical protein AOL_s00043g433 [Orbilia oligospora ATCC 24927]